MKKLVLISLLLTGCGYLPSINPVPPITATQTKEAVKTPSKPSSGKVTHQIRLEGKKGTKVQGGYVVMNLKNPIRMEDIEGVLPFTVDLDAPSDASVLAHINDFGLAEDVKPKVFIYRHGIDCGRLGVVSSRNKNPEASKVCSGELNLGQ